MRNGGTTIWDAGIPTDPKFSKQKCVFSPEVAVQHVWDTDNNSEFC